MKLRIVVMAACAGLVLAQPVHASERPNTLGNLALRVLAPADPDDEGLRFSYRYEFTHAFRKAGCGFKEGENGFEALESPSMLFLRSALEPILDGERPDEAVRPGISAKRAAYFTGGYFGRMFCEAGFEED